MNASEFRDALDRLTDTNSRKEKKDIIREVSQAPTGSEAAISFLSGSEFDDIGLGKKTVLSCAQDVYGDSIDGQPTVSENLEQFDKDGWDGEKMHVLRAEMAELSVLSGNEQKEMLRSMFENHRYPSVVSHACLNDLDTGVSDITIANTLDLRDALPFYDSVVEAAEAPNPIEEPMVHNAFYPMLAKSESNLPEDLSGYVGQPKLDGHRLLIHASEGGENVTAFTRRRNDVTESLPELQEIDWYEGEYILDAEVIAETGSYNDTSERIGRKAENVERDVEMEFGVFDVLTYNGRRIFELPYRERYGWTVTIADLTSDDRVGALPIYTDETKAKEVSSDYEGLIWKDLEASYEFGKRSTAWVKEKHQAESVDVRITGMVEGEGRLDGTMGKLSLESAEGVDVGYVGTGFTDEERDEIWQNSDEWVGGVIEVEAEAYDDGLRFPRYKRDRRDDGTADSIEKIRDVLPEA